MEMEVVYLGIFSWLFDKIFSAILSPIFKFISSLLEPVLTWLFENVLGPILEAVLWPLFEALLDLIMEILAGILYSIFAQVLEIIDAMQKAFNIFSGIDKITYAGKQYSFLEYVFQLNTIQRGVWIMIAISFVLTMAFAIIATVRSTLDLDGENNRPVSKVLGATFKAMLKLFLIPIVCLFAIVLSCRILEGINSAMGADQTSLGKIVFVVASLDACKQAEYNTSTGNSNNIGIYDSVRNDYYTGKKSYSDKKQVEQKFNLADFDYMVGFGAGIFLIVALFISLISFVTRIFEVILLFIVAPFFAAVQPLDDGEKFKGWQDMFVAKLFGGFGTVIAMQLYMILCPVIMGNTITFGQGSTEANYLLRIIFLLGGAWATIQMGPTVTSLISVTAGQAEASGNMALMHGVMAAGTMLFSGGGSRGIGAVVGGGQGGTSGEGGSGGEGDSGPVMGLGKAGLKGDYFGGKLTLNTSTGGHHYLGLNVGKVAKFGRDEKGNFNSRFLGVGHRVGKDGKLDKIAIPFASFKRGDDGKMHLSKVKLPFVRFKRAETVTTNPDGTQSRSFGNMYCSDVSVPALYNKKQRYDQETGKVETIRESKFMAGTVTYGKGADGQYEKKSSDRFFGLIHTEFGRGSDGQYHRTSVSTKGGRKLYERKRKD